MPGIEGLDVCRRIKEHHSSSEVVALTTFAEKHLVRACFQAGVRGFVLKHVEGFRLKHILRTVANGGTVIDHKMAAYLFPQGPDQEEENKASQLTRELTDQQIFILRLIGQGFSNKEISNKMVLSQNTVEKLCPRSSSKNWGKKSGGSRHGRFKKWMDLMILIKDFFLPFRIHSGFSPPSTLSAFFRGSHDPPRVSI